MPITSKQIADAAIQHGKRSRFLQNAIGDLQIAINLLKEGGLSERFEAELRNGVGLEVCHGKLMGSDRP